MRVIAGSAKRLKLKTIDGLETRPTTDRIKETLFNMIQDEIPDCRFLDLFSGSGGIGIEALSRGAQSAVFVENNKKAVRCILDNLAFTKLIKKGTVLTGDVLSVLHRLDGTSFDIVFMDPPYNQEWEYKVLTDLAGSSLLTAETLIIVEASLDTDFSYAEQLGYEILRIKKYKTNQHVFLMQKREEALC